MSVSIHALFSLSGPIAPIFLPGAWRRAKAKLEVVERLEATLDAAEIEQDMSSDRGAQTSNLITEPNMESPRIVISGGNSNANSDSIPWSMTAFMGMFEKETLAKPCVVVQLIEAPFPKISHVRQLSVENEGMCKLPMVRNRFIREEYFIVPGKCELKRKRCAFASYPRIFVS